jgi:hypothetical protein
MMTRTRTTSSRSTATRRIVGVEGCALIAVGRRGIEMVELWRRTRKELPTVTMSRVVSVHDKHRTARQD